MIETNKGKPDWVLIASIVVLLIIGSAFIYPIILGFGHSEVSEPRYVFRRYLTYLIISLGAVGIFFSCISIETIKKASYWCFGMAFILIAASMMPEIGYKVNGASRWIRIGSIKLLVAPLATLFMIIGTSRFLVEHFDQDQLHKTQSVKIIIALFVLFFLIMNQPDVTTFCILAILLVMLCYRAKFYKQSLLIALTTFVTLAGLILSEPYRRERFFAFLEPFEHQFDLTWQLSNNLLMIGGGDLLGQGYDQGVIPASPNLGGFIFATIVEETGFLGALIIIACSLLILWRSFSIAQNCLRSNRYFEGLVVIGIASWVALSGLLHIAACEGLIPTVNVYYPFLSYGKTSLFVAILAYGLVIRIGVSVTTPGDEKRVISQPLLYLFTGCFLAVGYYTFHLAVLDQDLDQRYQHRAEVIQKNTLYQQKQKNIFIDDSCSDIKDGKLICLPQRGKITDRWGRVLATNIPSYDIWVSPAKSDTKHRRWPELLALLGLNNSKRVIRLSERKEQNKQFFYLKRSVDKETAQTIQNLSVPGVNIDRDYRRYYPHAQLTEDIVGAVFIDNDGYHGVEESLNDRLSPNSGQQNSPESVQLSIDLRLQTKIYSKLKWYSEKSTAAMVNALVIDASTGEVLSMLRYPAINPNDRREAPLKKSPYLLRHEFDPAEMLLPFTQIESFENYYMLPRLGFIQLTKIELFDEVSGAYKNTKEVSATLLQLAKAYGIIANGGSHIGITVLKDNVKPDQERLFSQEIVDQVKAKMTMHQNDDRLLSTQSTEQISNEDNQPDIILQRSIGITKNTPKPVVIALFSKVTLDSKKDSAPTHALMMESIVEDVFDLYGGETNDN